MPAEVHPAAKPAADAAANIPAANNQTTHPAPGHPGAEHLATIDGGPNPDTEVRVQHACRLRRNPVLHQQWLWQDQHCLAVRRLLWVYGAELSTEMHNHHGNHNPYQNHVSDFKQSGWSYPTLSPAHFKSSSWHAPDA